MIKQYIVDAFTDRVFGGNPAAVCVLDSYPEDELMMGITLENNLSETAFAVPEGEGYHLRWFTPGGEIDFCGHATLATGFTILNFVQPTWDHVVFHTMSGDMTVSRKDGRYEMDFPAYDLQPVPMPWRPYWACARWRPIWPAIWSVFWRPSSRYGS